MPPLCLHLPSKEFNMQTFTVDSLPVCPPVHCTPLIFFSLLLPPQAVTEQQLEELHAAATQLAAAVGSGGGAQGSGHPLHPMDVQLAERLQQLVGGRAAWLKLAR